ncbi:helix-turn-helix domain-containing protein [Priestia endophytica]|uniref:helix-turn-helix domain-containing protein n=1 Tax=Priestia endophytica TaxID=135735 RepID=UPI0022820617|nr:helix-turn-helix domain-containing protein [Priestia endophytica]MCY8235535.1 helix-turn-helix domain-containing protein [Priestia endophytica]
MAKQAIEIIASEDTFKNLSIFENIDQLNETVRAHKEIFENELNKTQIAVLDLLHRYSAKYKGVSFLTKNKMADLLGKSRRTIIRACNHLEELGIIRQYEMKRSSDMQQTSNAIVIQPIEQPVEQPIADDTQETVKMSHQENNISLKQTHNINTIREESVSKKEIYPSFIPKRFIEKVRSYFPKVDDVYQLWGKIRLGYLHANVERPLEDLTDMAVNIVNDSIAALKLNRINAGQSFDALRRYTYGTAHRVFLTVKRQETVQKQPLINFLEPSKSTLVQKLEELSVEW